VSNVVFTVCEKGDTVGPSIQRDYLSPLLSMSIHSKKAGRKTHGLVPKCFPPIPPKRSSLEFVRPLEESWERDSRARSQNASYLPIPPKIISLAYVRPHKDGTGMRLTGVFPKRYPPIPPNRTSLEHVRPLEESTGMRLTGMTVHLKTASE